MESSAAEKPTVLIAGGGVSGLSLALFLTQSRQFNVRLLERSPELLPALGIHLGLNGALECLDRANLHHVWEPICDCLRRFHFRRHRSNVEIDIDMEHALASTAFKGKFGMFMRDEFQLGLAQALPEGVLECGREIVNVGQQAGKVVAELRDGSTVEGDIFVMADGINSSLRQVVLGDVHKIYSGIKVWYMISDEPAPLELQHSATELRSEGAVTMCFSAGSLAKHVVIVAQHALEPSKEDLEREGTPDHFHRVFTEFGAYEAGLITEERMRTSSQLLHFGVYHMPPGFPTWSNGRVCLLGDSVHAATPFMGQGPNQAVQSAFCLARLLRERGVADYAAVFKEYHRVRDPVTSKTIRRSAAFGKLRIPAADEGCFQAAKRYLLYALIRCFPTMFARMLIKQFTVTV